MEFDPFSGKGVALLELVWEPCINVRNGGAVGSLLRQPKRHDLGLGDAA